MIERLQPFLFPPTGNIVIFCDSGELEFAFGSKLSLDDASISRSVMGGKIEDRSKLHEQSFPTITKF